MTKRKASVALDNDNQSDQSLNDGSSRGVIITSGADGSSLNESDNVNSNRPATNQLMSQNGPPNSAIIDGRTVKTQTSNNQNDSSNSSIGNNNNTSNTIGGTNQQLNKGKKERADNWSNAEIQVLLRGIELRRDIFYGPPSQATKKNRELAWEAITKEVNAVSTTPRTLSQVMKKFKNEKCRAKRKFVDPEKDGHNSPLVAVGNNNTSVSNNNTNSSSATTTANDATNLRAQQQAMSHNVTSNNQQQVQQHHTHLMAAANAGSSAETITTPQAASFNVVKLAPQNVAKTMIDLPGHVQHTIQMPNDDMVLIVPPDMDGLLSGVNIVSDGTGHHFQKCSSNTLGNSQHSQHNQHAIQTINTNHGLMSGTMNNGMMARTIPAGSMCSLVYSTGNEVCGPEHHIAGQSSVAPNQISVSAHNLVHHRGPNLDQGQQQQHQMHHAAPQGTHQQHQQHQQPQQHPQQQQHPHSQHQQQQQQQQQQHHHHHQQQQHTQNTHLQSHSIQRPHLTQNNLTTSSTTASINATNNPGGAAVESQLKNLLFNLLLRDGQNSSVPNTLSSNQDYSKQRNDMLAMIASSLAKIESHLGKISKVAGALFSPNTSLGELISNQIAGQASQLIDSNASVSATPNTGGDNAGLTIASDNNNNSFNISNPVPAPNIASNQRND